MKTERKNLKWILIFCAGAAFGTVVVNILARVSVVDTSLITGYIRKLSQKPFDDIYFFIYLCISRLASFLILVFVAAVCNVKVIFIIFTGLFGATVAAIVSLASMVYGFGGILVAGGMFFPQYLIYIPMYIFLLKMVDNNNFNDTIVHTSVNGKNTINSVLLMVAVALVFVGCALECYVNPVVILQIKKIF